MKEYVGIKQCCQTCKFRYDYDMTYADVMWLTNPRNAKIRYKFVDGVMLVNIDDALGYAKINGVHMRDIVKVHAGKLLRRLYKTHNAFIPKYEWDKVFEEPVTERELRVFVNAIGTR